MQLRVGIVVFTLVALTGLAGANAQEWVPFTEVKSVCPECVNEKMTLVTLASGDEVTASLIAENPTFYVLERFNEMRAIGKDKVKEVTRGAEKRDTTAFGDQILLTNGTVLAGVINEDPTPAGWYKIVVGGLMHFVYKGQIQLAYRKGREVYRAR